MRMSSISILLFLLCFCCPAANAAILYSGEDPLPEADGYQGLWYSCGWYSGGLGTYCAKHLPFAYYAEEVNKTFFVYGGTDDSNSTSLHMVSYYDHETGMVPKPRILLDKQTTDGHDNPIIMLDDDGYIWVFSNSHGTERPSFIHRSHEPYSTDKFDEMPTFEFSYSQPWYIPGYGFSFLYTHYDANNRRNLYQRTSNDGTQWSEPTALAQIPWGQYQVSWRSGSKLGTAFNYHPNEEIHGANRTNLYYMESYNGGTDWYTVDGQQLSLPLTTPSNAALVHDFEADGRLVFMKDMAYDAADNPVILYLTSNGADPSTDNDPRIWETARWTGSTWDIQSVTQSDHNYDMGSLYIEDDGIWRIIAPTEPGPQVYATGGEVAVWVSNDQGANWTITKYATSNSIYNHSYCRKPVNANPEFYSFWADGSSNYSQSDSNLFFTDHDGTTVWQLPREMTDSMEKPIYAHGEQPPPPPTPVTDDRYQAVILSDNPVAYWRMNELGRVAVANIGSGGNMLDGVSVGVNLEANGPVPPDYKGLHPENTSGFFNGAGAHVKVADPGAASNLDFAAGDSITLEAWVYIDNEDVVDDQDYVVGKGRTINGATNQNYALRLVYRGVDDPARLGFIYRGTDYKWNLWETDASVPIGEDSGWHHLAITYTFADGLSIIGYIDGLAQDGEWVTDYSGRGNSNPVQDDDDLWIGSAQSGMDYSSIDGYIDEVAIYRAALSAERILAHYEAAIYPRIPGDANDEGKVDSLDASTLAANWRQTDVGWSGGDFNFDGVVDDVDATILATNWKKSDPLHTGVPEPGVPGLLLAALASLTVIRCLYRNLLFFTA